MWTLPNLLTLARILAAPLVPVVFLLWPLPQAHLIAFWLFTLAALTDYVDGALARAWNQQSPLGTMLDPIADKAMVVIALALLQALSDLDPLVTLPATAILLREVLVSGLREYLGDIKLAVTRLAKGKTAAQMVAIGLMLAPPGWGAAGLGLALLWLAAGLTVLTGADYFAKGLRHMRERG